MDFSESRFFLCVFANIFTRFRNILVNLTEKSAKFTDICIDFQSICTVNFADFSAIFTNISENPTEKFVKFPYFGDCQFFFRKFYKIFWICKYFSERNRKICKIYRFQ